MSAPTIPEPRAQEASGRLRGYAPWQLRDYLINKGIGTALINGLLLFISWSALQAGEAAIGPAIEAFHDRTFTEFTSNLILFGVLFATNGIVSEDRKLGYYRFYFTKPVSVAAFYAQKFFVHVAGLLLIAALMLAVHGFVIRPHFPPAFFPVVAMAVLGLAGIGFLVSAVFTLDWLSLFAIYAASQVTWLLYGNDEGLRGLLVRALPPVHRLSEAYLAMAQGEPVPTTALWWVFVYGAVCFVLGLVVISRRRLATN